MLQFLPCNRKHYKTALCEKIKILKREPEREYKCNWCKQFCMCAITLYFLYKFSSGLFQLIVNTMLLSVQFFWNSGNINKYSYIVFSTLLNILYVSVSHNVGFMLIDLTLFRNNFLKFFAYKIEKAV